MFMEYVISKDGHGDFRSLQEAVDALPERNADPCTLVLMPGIYRGRVIVNRDHLRIRGTDAKNTVLVHNGCAKDLNSEGREKGTFLSYTLLVTGNDVTVEDLTVQNDAGDGREVGQAVAVYAAGERGRWINCRFIACQDTLFCGPTMPKVQADALPRKVPAGVPSVGDCPPVTGQQVFENCFIQGDVDFIFGPYACLFEHCTLFMNERGGWYTAANTPGAGLFGLVFRDCRLTGACAPGEAYLGRPWRAYARTVFLNCEMDDHVAPAGFADWDEVRVVTERYAEFGSRGAGADTSHRHPEQKLLTKEEADTLLPAINQFFEREGISE